MIIICKRQLLLLLFICVLTRVSGYVGNDSILGYQDSLSTLLVDTIKSKQPQKKSFFRKFVDYFNDANKPKNNKKFDFSVIGGPHYSSDVGLGLGLVGSGLYRMDRSDTIMQPSIVSFYGDIATSGFYLLGVRGTNFFPHDKYRLVYNFYFFSFPSYFWGMGYENASNKDNKSKYKRLQNQARVDFLFRLAHNLYFGPGMSFNYVEGKDFEDVGLLEGQSRSNISVGAGLSLVYDSRDFLTNAYKGMYLKLEQNFYPSFLGTKSPFNRTDLIFDYYQPLWDGAIWATDFHSMLNYGDTPWTMMAMLGGSSRMRGYYEGQYRDNNIVELQMELRQHVWKRNGIAVWAGGGNIFKDFDHFKWSHTLPNYGLGYRWEFKKRVNVRLDYGFGKGQSGFIFNINEAF